METTMNPCAAKAQTQENGLANGLENARRLAASPAGIVPAAAPSPGRYFGIEDSGEDWDTEYDITLRQIADGVTEGFDAPE